MSDCWNMCLHLTGMLGVGYNFGLSLMKCCYNSSLWQFCNLFSLTYTLWKISVSDVTFSSIRHLINNPIIYEYIPTYFMLCGVSREDHGHEFPPLGAASQAVDTGYVGAFVVHRLHKLSKTDKKWSYHGRFDVKTDKKVNKVMKSYVFSVYTYCNHLWVVVVPKLQVIHWSYFILSVWKRSEEHAWVCGRRGSRLNINSFIWDGFRNWSVWIDLHLKNKYWFIKFF